MDDRIAMRRLESSGENMDGFLALLIMMVFIFCAAWAPACIRRCYRRSDAASHGRRSSAIDPRMEAEIEMFRRMMEEAVFAIAPREGMTVDARREYILNCLMTKHIIAYDKQNTDTTTAAMNERDDVVLNLGKDREDEEDDPKTTCAICLSEYEDGDEISWSHNPNCPHFFHRTCIAEWLLSHEECPCCRFDFLRFDDDDEQVDIETGSRDLRVPPISNNDPNGSNADFARSLQLFFELVANRRPAADVSSTSEVRNRATAMSPAREAPRENDISTENTINS